MIHGNREANHPAQALKDIEVLDLEGRPFRLGELWQQQPVLLTFIRHFG